jgi:hypothetical protein
MYMPNDQSAKSVAQPQTGASMVVDNFLPADLATSMRSDIDSHFATPFKQRPDTHQIWNFWFVPGQYTYFRTQPEKIVRRASVEQFARLLREWSTETLGLAKLYWPFLSMYISGCRQGLHNDARNGRFAYVYSLTRNVRRSTGGETLLFRAGDPFRRNLQKAVAGQGLYELIEPRFNRLVVFDDRMVHGVERIDGSMDPQEGRFVMHGHLEETPPIINGALPPEPVQEQMRLTLERFFGECSPGVLLYHGPLILRFAISPDGKTTGLRILLDRVFSDQEGNMGWESLKRILIGLLASATFPAAPGVTRVTLPILFGGPVVHLPGRK